MEATTYKIIVKTQAGLEHVLAEELKTLGCANPETLVRAVAIDGTVEQLYKINYCSRIALKVLKVFGTFHFTDNESFYNNVKALPWEQFLLPEGNLAIEAIQSHSIFTNTHFLARFTKDAIVDRFREKFNKRPDVELIRPDLMVNVHINKNYCTVSLDSSQMSLHKRGYRKTNVEAPINEVTAAGIIQLSDWQGQSDFFDPMCGSGTLLIEAAMYALNIPAGYFRKNYGFMRWKNYDENLFNKIVAEAEKLIRKHQFNIYGCDILRKNIRIADENIRFANLQNTISIKPADFFETPPPFKKGIIITNPPYGERLQLDNAVQFFKNFGDALKRHYAGCTAWVFSQNNEAIKNIGLRPTRKISLYNGKLECKLLRYEMYEGTKKQVHESNS